MYSDQAGARRGGGGDWQFGHDLLMVDLEVCLCPLNPEGKATHYQL